jgi:hypothetical protein
VSSASHTAIVPKLPDIPDIPHGALHAALVHDGYVFVHADAMRQALEAVGPLDDWNAFAASWNDLETDTHMADGGRYRRRRHAVFVAGPRGEIRREAHQPHFQALDYNPLNGGVARWFAPVTDAAAGTSAMRTILQFSRSLFGRLAPDVTHWKIEVHQFRIEARVDAAGLPTPEGLHRDGVDWVLVLLVDRTNIASGTTSIHAPDGRELGRFTLTEPLDAALVDDARVSHGVTPVEAIDASVPAYRDVLVVTFNRSQT